VRQLAEDDQDGQAEDEAGDYRLGEEFRDPADAEEARGDQDETGAQGQGRRVRRSLRRAGDPEAGEQRARQHRHRRHRTHDELPRRAEDRVRHQCHRHRVEAHLDRGTGDRGVAERLGDGQRRHHGTGDDIAA
jgi:hypothetical protein